MAFINEKIPEKDIQKYGIAEINKKFHKAHYKPEWTVDRDRDIYLRWIKADHEMQSSHDFTFYWKGTLLNPCLKSRSECEDNGLASGTGGIRTWSIYPRGNYTKLALPIELESQRDEITADLKEALTAYGEFGTRSKSKDYTVKFEF